MTITRNGFPEGLAFLIRDIPWFISIEITNYQSVTGSYWNHSFLDHLIPQILTPGPGLLRRSLFVVKVEMRMHWWKSISPFVILRKINLIILESSVKNIWFSANVYQTVSVAVVLFRLNRFCFGWLVRCWSECGFFSVKCGSFLFMKSHEMLW